MAINRVTGTNSGIDVDAVVKASLTAEQNKIDKAYQQQKIYEYQQEQLKEIVDQCTDFYDKYLDILSSDSLLKSSAYETVSFTGDNNNVTAVGYAGADVTEYKVKVNEVASKASTILDKDYFSDTIFSDKVDPDNPDNIIKGNSNGILSVKFGDKEANIAISTDKDGNLDLSATAKALNEEFTSKGLNVTAKYSEISGGIVIESKTTGEAQEFQVGIIKGKLTENFDSKTVTYNKNGKGTDASITITKGNSVITKQSSTNSISVDNIQFTVNSKGDTTTLTGKNESEKLKDTIVNFINDYNKLIQTINDKLLEKRESDYMPLTEEQKKDMTESEIKKWEEKAKTGLLRNDSDLKRIQSALKDSMRTFMDSSGLNLEKIGIKPVDNYGSKNGTFTIDETVLSAAIENNAEEVKDLFTRASDSKVSKNSAGGILTQLQSVLKNETKSSSSSLSKRIGFSGTATENNNTLSRYIDKQKKLITEFKSKYASREAALYKKYSALETMLEKLNAQSNSLYSMLNIG